MQDIFRYEQHGVSGSGKAFGNIVSTGVRPGFVDRLRAAGATVNPEWFVPRVLVADEDR
jgi:hypothetical protein